MIPKYTREDTSQVLLLAIDTSCDDTAVAVLRNDCVLANVVSSQIDVHQEWGGVVPRLAKRCHQHHLAPCIELAVKRSRIGIEDLDAIAVTYGPGLAPALEVGVAKAKELAAEYDKPLIAVNHMEGHVLSPLLKNRNEHYYARTTAPQFPLLSMLVSGGHTEIVWVESIGYYRLLGQTLDDAAGEALDKVARMLELGYPGGPIVERIAEGGDCEKIKLPRPMSRSNDYNFSFSGPKTACLYKIRDLKAEIGDGFAEIVADFCASLQEAVIDSLLVKLRRAAVEMHPKQVFVAGGVSANNRLRSKFRQTFRKLKIPLVFPHKKFCTDNAAMIGLAAYHQYQRREFIADKETLDRDPALTIEA